MPDRKLVAMHKEYGKAHGGDDKLAVPLKNRLRAYLLCVVLPIIIAVLQRGGAEV